MEADKETVPMDSSECPDWNVPLEHIGQEVLRFAEAKAMTGSTGLGSTVVVPSVPARLPFVRIVSLVLEALPGSHLFRSCETCPRRRIIYFIMPGGPLKSDLERRLMHDLGLSFPDSYISCSSIKFSEDCTREVNIGLWRRKPTLEQRRHPIQQRIPVGAPFPSAPFSRETLFGHTTQK
jgi:hypothetical protein